MSKKLFLKWSTQSTLEYIAETYKLSMCNGKISLYKKQSENSLLELFKDSKIELLGAIHKMETYSFIGGKMEGPSNGDYIETLELNQMGESFYVRAYCEDGDYYLDISNAAEKRLCLMITNEFAKGNDYIPLSDVCKHENYNAVLKAALLLEKNGVIKLIKTSNGVVYRLEEKFVSSVYLSLYTLYDDNLRHAENSFHNTYANAPNKDIFCGCIEFTKWLLTMYSSERLLKLRPESIYFLPAEETSHTPIIDTLCQMYEIELRNGKTFDLQGNEEMNSSMVPESLLDWFIESVTEKTFYAFDEGYSYLDELLKELLDYKNRMKNIPVLTKEEVQIVKTALHQYGNKCMLNDNGEKERELIWKIEEKF